MNVACRLFLNTAYCEPFKLPRFELQRPRAAMSAGDADAPVRVFSLRSKQACRLDFFGTFLVKQKSTEESRYTYDTKGLMSSRSESVLKLWEKYSYDNLDRLTGVESGVTGQQQGTLQAFLYDGNGNLSDKSLIGNYTYGIAAPAPTNKPHAVTKITNTSSCNFSKVTYNFYNQPIEITEGIHQLDISYGANQQRNKAIKYKNGNIENTRYYINKYYEKELDTANVTKHYHYIYGDNGVVALDIGLAPRDYIITPNDSIMLNDTTISGGTPHRIISSHNLYYLHPDHLGCYCVLTDKNKNVVQNNRFDPWGNNVGTANFSLISRGFTGHEHYPQFKIINMNARLYDPVIGRFFSPDNYVQIPEFTQSFNRYSYALNREIKSRKFCSISFKLVAFINSKRTLLK